MKKEKQIIRKWQIEGKRFDKLTKKHFNSKESKIKGYVTKQEHITGERLSSVHGFILALEWVIDNDSLLILGEENNIFPRPKGRGIYP